MARSDRPAARAASRAVHDGALPLVVDATFAFDTALGPSRGLRRPAFDALRARGSTLLDRTARERAAGGLAFLDLPARRELVRDVVGWARPRRARATDVLLVGIGGSSRTAPVLAAAAPSRRRGVPGRPRLHVLDTVDPQRAEDVLAGLDPRRTVLVAISKAGTTMETVAGYLVAQAWMRRALGPARTRDRVAVVAGEERNPLRDHAEREGYACFAVPRGVGGRFSGLSPVGTLPAALLGVDVARVLRGAAAVEARLARDEVETNPALALALVHHLALSSGRAACVAQPYSDALAPFALWWEQLLGESLGKRGAAGPVGPTPVPGIGPSDQHSLLQLLVEGPDDKLVVFFDVEDLATRGPRVPRPRGWATPVAGKRLGEILAAEREATELSLAEAGRPSLRVTLPSLSPEAIGALLYVHEVAVTWWGWLADVDPFGQPGVERCKVVTTASLTGAPEEAARALTRHRAVPRLRSR